MCKKCQELDYKIEHYRQMSRMVSDKIALDGIQALIEQCFSDKKVLHPENP